MNDRKVIPIIGGIDRGCCKMIGGVDRGCRKTTFSRLLGKPWKQPLSFTAKANQLLFCIAVITPTDSGTEGEGLLTQLVWRCKKLTVWHHSGYATGLMYFRSVGTTMSH